MHCSFNISANESAIIYMKTSNTNRFSISDTLTIIYTNLTVNGSTTLTGVTTLNNNLSVAGIINNKQSILWNYITGTSPNEYYLSPSSMYNIT